MWTSWLGLLAAHRQEPVSFAENPAETQLDLTGVRALSERMRELAAVFGIANGTLAPRAMRDASKPRSLFTMTAAPKLTRICLLYPLRAPRRARFFRTTSSIEPASSLSIPS